MYLHSLTGCAAPLWRPDGEPHIRLKPTLTLFPLRTFAAMATLPPAPMPTRAGSFRQHLREPRIKDGTGAFSQTAHHGQVTYTVTTCNTEPFSSSSIPQTTPPFSRKLVRLLNAQSMLMAAFLLGGDIKGNWRQSNRQFTKDINTTHSDRDERTYFG